MKRKKTVCVIMIMLSYVQATENSICLDLLAADVNGFHYGVKLVRGAYMEQERTLAVEKGYTDNN